MARLVLLGLGEEDVDVLSRIARLAPRPEVLVFHPEPRALILRLAAIADWETTTEPPEPRADDLLVVPAASTGPAAEWIEGWRRAGARVVPPANLDVGLEGELRTALVVSAAAGAYETIEPVLDEPEFLPAEPDPPRSQFEHAAKGDAMDTRTEHSRAATQETDAPRTRQDTAPRGAPMPPADAWASPEGTFRYLVEQALGPGRDVSLWWNGGTDVWVPWAFSGNLPPQGSGAPEGSPVTTAWGDFRLVGASVDQLNRSAMQRIAEDMALRDLMTWRETARSLGRHGLPAPSADKAQLATWLDPIWGLIDAKAALIWRRAGSDWTLMATCGSGVTLSGVLTFSEELLGATLDTPDSPWRPWAPISGFRLYLNVKDDDARLPLRLRRIEVALREDVAR